MSGIQSGRYRNEQKYRCRNQSGSGKRGPSPVPECSGTGLRYRMPERRCRRHRPRCRCPAMVFMPFEKFASACWVKGEMIRPVAEATRNRNKEIGTSASGWGILIFQFSSKVEHPSKQNLLRSRKLTNRRKTLKSCEGGSVVFFDVTEGNIMYLTDGCWFLISCVIQHYAPVVGLGGGRNRCIMLIMTLLVLTTLIFILWWWWSPSLNIMCLLGIEHASPW